MSVYTYYFHDLLTNQQIDDVPLYGVGFDRKLSGVGTFTGTCRLDDERKTPQGILDATIPDRTALYVDRNGALVWGGIVWTRTWQEQGKDLQLYAETFESFAYKQIIKTTSVYTSVDPMNIMRSIWTNIQADPRANIGMVIPGAFTTTKPVSKTYNGYEYTKAGEAIDALASADTGFDFYVQVAYNSSNVPTKTLVIGRPLGALQSNTGLAFQYPGSVTNFWYPESGGDAVTTLYGIGKGDGVAAFQTTASSADLLGAGYPLLADVVSFKDAETQALLDSLVKAEAQRRRPPIIVPTFEVDPTQEPQFGGYGLGDYAIFDITSDRFPSGIVSTFRIIGWRVSPSSSDQVDSVSLVLEGSS